jgi:hypothetical protein
MSLRRTHSPAVAGDIAAYLATLDISAFNAKAPPLKTAAFWAIVDSNRPAEEAEIMDALDMLNNPDAITFESLMTGANSDLFAFVTERKNRKAVSHRIIAAGYEIVRNDVARDGLWVVNGARKTIYAKKTLTVPERIKAARQLAAAAPKSDWERKSDEMDIERRQERQAKAEKMSQAMH